MKFYSSNFQKNDFECRSFSKKTFFKSKLQLGKYLDSKKIKNLNQKSFLQEKVSTFSTSSHKEIVLSEDVFFNTCFDKNNLKTLIAWFLEKYGQKKTIDLVETLKEIGFHQATTAGVSLGIDDLQIPPQKSILLSQASLKMQTVRNEIESGNLTSVEKSQRLIDTWNQTSETLRQTAVQNFRTTNPVNPVYMMAFSGARGNISQVRQLVAMRGLMADPQGAILEFPIQSNFREGLTVTEYLISCYGARKGLVDTALRTATSGYLTRRLVDAVQHVVIQITDCETKKGILIKDKNLEQRLVGRVLLEDLNLNLSKNLKKNTLISPKLAKEIALNCEKVLVRSPLTCKTEKSVCQLCYGIDLAQGKLVSIGEAVGIIAAQSIGEPGTQLTMRTFHTGGVGVFSDQALKSFISPFEGKIYFSESIPGLFVRTPHGNIVYLLKHKNPETNKVILTVKEISNENNKYEIFYHDVPSGSILWVKEGQIVKAGQLLVQASRLQSTTQEMPESTHPVKSTLSGEVFFQSMAIRVIEEEKRFIQKTKKKKTQSLTSSQINQKEISPTFPTLIELGNFWIFSSFIQKESAFAKSFFVKGDLISVETPIYEYNLHLPKKGQIKKVKSSIVLADKATQLSFSKIYYSNLTYFLISHTVKNKKFLISYKTNKKQTILTCYPSLNLFPVHSAGYLSVVKNEKNRVKLSENLENLKLSIPHNSEPLNSRYFWTPYPIFLLKHYNFEHGFSNCGNQHKTKLFSEETNEFLVKLETSNKKLTSFQENYQKTLKKFFNYSGFILIKGKNTLSKNGLYQLDRDQQSEPFQEKKWKINFRKNPLKNFQHKKVSCYLHKEKKLTNFLKNSLDFSKKFFLIHSQFRLIEQPKTWCSVPEKSIAKNTISQTPRIVLEGGKKLSNVVFDRSPISINLLDRDSFCVFTTKSFENELKFKKHNFSKFYSIEDIIELNKTFRSDFSSQLPQKLKNSFDKIFARTELNSFCFYTYENNSLQNKFNLEPCVKFFIKRKEILFNLLLFQKSHEYLLPELKNVKDKMLKTKKLEYPVSLNSPLFTKQFKTIFTKTESTKFALKVETQFKTSWLHNSQIFKIQIPVEPLKTCNKIEQLQNKILIEYDFADKNLFKKDIDLRKYSAISEIPIPEFSVISYRKFILPKFSRFYFEMFSNNYILPEYKLTCAFLKAKKLGEFRGSQIKQDDIRLSILQNKDKVNFKTLTLNSLNAIRVGTQVRWGQEFGSNFAIPMSGQILKLSQTQITLRTGLPLLASVRGLIHISHNDFIEKNDLLITLRSRRLQTEDIVQGIPKIEQLFEARETQGGEIIQNNMHTLLNSFFIRAKQVKPIDEAVQLSFTYIQKFLVDNILAAYSTQGVHIAEKHVEVVVRQMTARVRITDGGDSGLLPGEFIQIRLIEKVNEKLVNLKRRPAQYEPVILGITKSVLQSESFLLAASFQQVSKVLVRSALSRKTDFLRGLHENVLVGQAIPAGTGIIDLLNYETKLKM